MLQDFEECFEWEEGKVDTVELREVLCNHRHTHCDMKLGERKESEEGGRREIAK